MTHSAATVLCLAWTLLGQPEPAPGVAQPAFVTGRVFQKVLEQPISMSSLGIDLRSALRRIESERRVSILLDRRLDPNRLVDVSAVAGVPGVVLEQLTANARGRAVAVGNTVFLGPASSAGKLRTLVRIRETELVDRSQDERDRRQELTARSTFAWQDLDRPADLVQKLCDQYHLKVEGLNQVPHDLWAGAVLPQTNLVEALTLVLVQFDLTFAWADRLQGVRIEAVPDTVAFELGHRPPRGVLAAAAAQKWREAFPNIKIHAQKGEVVVVGTVEDHEAIEWLAHPEKRRRPSDPQPADALALQRFTLRIKDAPLRQVMKTLSDSPGAQLVFEYDAEELNAFGVDLDQKIEIEVKMATVEMLLAAIFESTGLGFELQGRRVRLKAKPR